MRNEMVIQKSIDELVRSVPNLSDSEELELVQEKITYLESLLEEK